MTSTRPGRGRDDGGEKPETASMKEEEEQVPDRII